MGFCLDPVTIGEKMVCWLLRKGPQRLLAKVKNASGRIGIFLCGISSTPLPLVNFHRKHSVKGIVGS